MVIHHDFTTTSPSTPRLRPFDSGEMFARVEDAAADLPLPLHSSLYAAGYQSLFQHLAISVIAARTPDAVTTTAAAALFRWAPTATVINRLSVAQITSLIEPVALAEAKAARLKDVSRVAVEKYAGEFPPRERVLRALPGVGVTCANLILGLVAHQEKLCVGSHVMRVTRRWGLVTASSAGGVESQLSQLVPREKWRFVGEWFVAFGDHVCTRLKPKCERCPLSPYCRRVDV